MYQLYIVSSWFKSSYFFLNLKFGDVASIVPNFSLVLSLNVITKLVLTQTSEECDENVRVTFRRHATYRSSLDWNVLSKLTSNFAVDALESMMPIASPVITRTPALFPAPCSTTSMAQSPCPACRNKKPISNG